MCSESDGKLGPDADLGRRGEGIPYGVKLVQADDPAMVEVAKKFRSKVLFCVIDTGLDRSNKEFNNASELSQHRRHINKHICQATVCNGMSLPALTPVKWHAMLVADLLQTYHA